MIKHALPHKSVYLVQAMIPGSKFLLVSNYNDQVQIFERTFRLLVYVAMLRIV